MSSILTKLFQPRQAGTEFTVWNNEPHVLPMKYGHLIHNPTAGEGEHSKKSLLEVIHEAGYSCSYSSTKEPGWEKIKEDQTDFIVVAGGDGTVRKVAEELLSRNVLDKQFPIALIPSGTANNIGNALHQPASIKEVVHRWSNETLQKFDVSKITNLKGARFFLEGFGHGVFPELIKAMKKRDEMEETPDLELQKALSLLHDIVLFYKARPAKIVLDDKEYDDHYLLIEVMNIQSVGPHLDLAPEASSNDGYLDVVMIPETQREKLARYVHSRLMNDHEKISFETIKARKVSLQWEGHFCHADDQLIEINKNDKIDIELMEGVLEFLI
jgi:diacylglycerol kinase (ATP)